MKKYIILTIKIVITVFLIIAGLLILTEWRLYGIHLLGLYVPASQVNMFIDSAEAYLYILYVLLVLFVVWGIWFGMKVFKRNDK